MFEELETQKEERSEYLTMWVTKKVKKEFEAAKGNKELEESIIRQFIKRESDWLEDEMKQIDESAIKYKAKLIGIKDSFAKVQGQYVEEIEAIYEKAEESTKDINNLYNNVREKMVSTYQSISELDKRISSISTYGLERLLDAVDRYNNLNESQKEIIKILLEKDSK